MPEPEHRIEAVVFPELRKSIHQLERAERDLEERLAGRAAALGGTGAPVSDPLYQRLFFILAGLRERRAGAEGELVRRAGASTREEGRPSMKTVVDRVELALDAALAMTFPASDPVAISVPEALAKPAAGESDRSNERMLELARRLGFEIQRAPDARTVVASPGLQRRPDPPRVKLF
jgi:hypothetical protein